MVTRAFLLRSSDIGKFSCRIALRPLQLISGRAFIEEKPMNNFLNGRPCVLVSNHGIPTATEWANGTARAIFRTGTSMCRVGVAVLLLGLIAAIPQQARAQTSSTAADAIRHGEFSLAAQIAERLPSEQSDAIWSELAQAQMRSGAYHGMWQSAQRISSDRLLNSTASGLFHGIRNSSGAGSDRPRQGAADSAATPRGGAGGITMQDFTPLINLIQSTVAPDDWATTQGEGTILPYVSGVYIDALGTLHRFQPDRSGRLDRLKAKLALNQQVNLPSEDSAIRQISLIQLERAAQMCAVQGKPLPDDLQNMAGIYDLHYLLVIPESNDIVIAGPAGPCHRNGEGIVVNTQTGRPVLQLDDLVNCLRSVWYDGGRFGCSITPRQQNLAATQEFLTTSKLTGKAWRSELQQQLGRQDIDVFGIPRNTTTARILVEADYRMKLIGMGLEPAVDEVPSYLDRASKDLGKQPLPLDVARWWFTLDYEGISVDSSKRLFQLDGTGVKVLSETELLDPQGARIHTGKSIGPTKEFAEDFSKHFDAIAQNKPIFNELRNVFDLALVCSLIKREKLDRLVDWNLTYFGRSDSPENLTYSPKLDNVAREVDSVMNHKQQTVREGNKRIQHTLVGISGGIDCPINQWVNQTQYRPLPDETKAKLQPVHRDAHQVWWD